MSKAFSSDHHVSQDNPDDAAIDRSLRQALDADSEIARRLVTRALKSRPARFQRSGPLAAFAVAASLLIGVLLLLWTTRPMTPQPKPHPHPEAHSPASLRISNEDGFVAVTSRDGERWIVLTGDRT